jgi:alanyl aminopeptidase
MSRFASLLLLSVAAAAAQAPAIPGLRLPADVRPLSYTVDLQLVPGQDEFTGQVAIDIEVLRGTRVVWLHAKELKLTSIRVGEANAAALPLDYDFLAVLPETPLAPGRATITIDYTGTLSRSLTDGVFQQDYNGDSYIFTKFEPVTARRAFPCFDEPSFKTPWQLTLHVPAALKAVSNTPEAGEAPEANGMKAVRFVRSKPLPSYLVAFAVGPFDFAETAPLGRNRVPGRIVAPRGRAAEAAWAAAATPRMVELLEDFFGSPFPYEKLDQIVVPLTTAWGAMENAGLIAYGQSLLAKPDQDTTQRQRSRLSTMVHETSHMWVGDLVTMAWWNDLWLNEGFATWVTPKILDRWHPEWRMRSSAATSANSVMSSDALVSARKVRQPIDAPGDIALAFDGITYSKGAAVLNMFENWMGEETFRKGVRDYLAQHAWGATTTADLMAALSKAAGRDISAAFSSFLDQAGAPLVTAEVQCGGKGATLRLSQERFVPIGSQGAAPQLWKVPVCYREGGASGEHRACVLLEKPSAGFPLAACPAWFYPNENAAGYYRWSYPGDTGIDKLSRPEQVSALDNAQALASAGKLAPPAALALAERFGGSDDPDLVRSALRISGVFMQLVPDDWRPRYATFLRDWLGPRARDLGWLAKPGESEETRQIRQAIVPLVTIDGRDLELGKEARRMAEAWLKDRSAIDPDTAGLVLVAAARQGDRELFDLYVSELRKAKDQRERSGLISGLAAFPDPALMNTALAMILQPGDLDSRELRSLITSQWPETRQAVWDYVKRNFDELNERLPGARGIPYGATLPSAAGGFCDEPHAADLERFFNPKVASLSGSARNLARTLESIRLCSARRAALAPGIEQFLKARP